jgi:hypothetical protein
MMNPGKPGFIIGNFLVSSMTGNLERSRLNREDLVC